MANTEHNSETISSSDSKKDYRKKIKNLEETLKKESDLTLAQRKKIEKTISVYKWELEQELNENSLRNRKKDIEEEHQLKMKKADEEGNKLKKWWEESFGTASAAAATIQKATESLTNQLDTVIQNYIDKQQSISAHLVGSSSLTTITSNLTSALSTSTLVKQEAVYNKLASLVQSGIVYNVEQRAFLQTIADDIDLNFGQDGQLNRLIRLQGQDSTANRLALAYSLQEFLNENYKTSEYLASSFASVADSLIDAESLMTTGESSAYEATVQTWLGSLSSKGAQDSTISGLASALNELGSGNISNLGSGISNLLLMAISRSGNLDYSDLINNGVSASEVDTIMSNVVSYLSEINNSESNVVKSQLGKVFGVGITDLVAASKLNSTTTTGSVTTDIYSALLDNYGSLVPFATQLNNVKNNALFTWGADVASSPGQYIAYSIESLLSKSGLGEVISGIGEAKSGITGAALSALGYGISAAPLISLFTSGAFGDIVSSLSTTSNGLNSAAGIFNALGAANNLGSTIKISGNGVSGSAYYSSTGLNDMLSGTNNSMNDILSEVETETGDEHSSEYYLELINTDVYNIWSLLDNNINDIVNNITSISDTLSLIKISQQ